MCRCTPNKRTPFCGAPGCEWPQTPERKKTPENFIHNLASIHTDAKIGHGNYFGPYVVIGPNVRIGDGNRFESHSAVGMPGEHRDFFDKFGPVEIGDDNTIREFTTIQGGTNDVTMMGNRCVMLRGSHLSHDSVLEDNVGISCNVLIGGHSYIMRGANLGLGAIIHQRQLIGSWSMLGMGTIVTAKQKIKPGHIYVGNPARELKLNQVGLQRAGLTAIELIQEVQRFDLLSRKSK